MVEEKGDGDLFLRGVWSSIVKEGAHESWELGAGFGWDFVESVTGALRVLGYPVVRPLYIVRGYREICAQNRVIPESCKTRSGKQEAKLYIKEVVREQVGAIQRLLLHRPGEVNRGVDGGVTATLKRPSHDSRVAI